MQPSHVNQVRAMVEELRKTNLRTGTDRHTGFAYRFLCTSPDEYRWQWFWNSCFHAVAMSHVDPELAVAELRTLFAAQEADGFMGHINFWDSRFFGDLWGRVQSSYAWRQHHTALIQPPVLAQSVERVTEVVSDAWLAVEFLPQLDLYHQWLSENRAPDPDGLLVSISPYESGMAQSPTFDEVLGMGKKPGRWNVGLRSRWLDLRLSMRSYDDGRLPVRGPFRVKDVLVNTLYADSLSTMARLHHRHGQGAMATAYARKSDQITASIVGKMWDRGRGAFYGLYGPNGRRTSPTTVSSLMPLLLPELPEEAARLIVERHLEDKDKFALPFPVPSVAVSEPTFDPRGEGLIWRGPSWVNTNWLLWRGLRRHGFKEQAARLARQTVGMVAGHGLREFYHPYNGQGLGSKSFGWSGLALDMASPD
jgi:hypothetical protein